MQARFEELLQRFTAAVEAGDGRALAETFCPDGVYHDVFYGAFAGREAIAGMLEGLLHREGSNLKWGRLEPVASEVALFHRRHGLCTRYDAFVRSAEVLLQLGMPAEKRERVMQKMLRRQLEEPGWQEHGWTGGAG